ncbi:HoxN/HupN/NixA family nickel/cobalt transporter [Aquicella lusitana]|uniref:Nickel/cobalt efflux system n=1 Tax=Aquicella lusitana TaxID=254246 RepID=A0A370GHX7_9COXI|nr:DNA repair protein [Aquicella lusitana]RDI43408.1 high-affinity nickel-transport protein [Aquicella lusitana]VVC73558.1 High-affinity nickel transport protein [Aquicella lusitana]
MHNDLLAMFIIVLLLGMRHGLDLDHLAAIDAMTRNVSSQKTLVKLVGILFSVGHGSVVIIISIIVGISMKLLQLPAILGFYAQLASILFLLLFSLVNFYSVFQAIRYQQAGMMTPKLLIISKLLKNVHHPFAIFCVGGIFAVSFDTVSQIAFFSLSSSAVYGWIIAMLLGVVFMAGMILIDGVNGYLLSLIIRRADYVSRLLSRMLGVAIGLFGFTMSVDGIIKLIMV